MLLLPPLVDVNRWNTNSDIYCYLQWENSMLAEKLNTEKEQNNQLRSQLAHLFQVEQEQKILIQGHDSTIKSLQVEFLLIECAIDMNFEIVDI